MSRIAANDVPPDVLEDERDEEELAPEAGSGIELDFEATPASVEAGAALIRRFWATLPGAPGVYRMIDAKGDVLYVGKAKSLKARVGSYVRGNGHTNRIARMIAETASMEFVTTATETEALLLEANLIKQLRPRYNVVLRDDKSLPYILLTADTEAPQVVKHRGARNRKGHYFGPFASVWAVNRTINALQRAFLLRSCSDSYYENRTRPCLLFQIKRCSGPCTGEIDRDEYGKLAEAARAFLSGRSSAVKDQLAAEMNHAAEDLEFERAARYRDRLAALSAVQSTQGINTQNTEEADVIAIDDQAGQFCVEVFFFRNHQNWGNRAYFPKADKSVSRGEVLASFVAQFYDDKPPPRLVFLSEDIEECALLASALTVKAGRKVEISVPQRGERRQLIEAALRNAKEALGRRLAETSSQAKLLASLGGAFGLPRAPRRIEVYDNSHIMGTNAVGAMIVAGPAGLMKTHYRTFNMRSEELTPGDDYAMMREMLRRRFARLVKEAPREPSPSLPDPHAEVQAEGEPRSTQDRSASCEGPLRGPPQDEDGGARRPELGRPRCLPGLARSRPHRRRERAARGGEDRPPGGRRDRGRARRRRQGPRPRCRTGDLLFPRPGADPSAAARPGLVLRTTPAGRGAPLRDRRPPGEAQARHDQKPARRDSRDRASAQARAPPAFWDHEGDPARRARRPHARAGRERSYGPHRVRLFPRHPRIRAGGITRC
jgi:excinuclease ABC subunit C